MVNMIHFFLLSLHPHPAQPTLPVIQSIEGQGLLGKASVINYSLHPVLSDSLQASNHETSFYVMLFQHPHRLFPGVDEHKQIGLSNPNFTVYHTSYHMYQRLSFFPQIQWRWQPFAWCFDQYKIKGYKSLTKKLDISKY